MRQRARLTWEEATGVESGQHPRMQVVASIVLANHLLCQAASFQNGGSFTVVRTS